MTDQFRAGPFGASPAYACFCRQARMGMYAAAAYTTAHRLAPRDGAAGGAYRRLAAKWLRSLEIKFAQKVRWHSVVLPRLSTDDRA